MLDSCNMDLKIFSCLSNLHPQNAHKAVCTSTRCMLDWMDSIIHMWFPGDILALWKCSISLLVNLIPLCLWASSHSLHFIPRASWLHSLLCKICISPPTPPELENWFLIRNRLGRVCGGAMFYSICHSSSSSAHSPSPACDWKALAASSSCLSRGKLAVK